MRAIIETVFDILYLVTVLTVGIRMIRGSKNNPQFRLFGLMAVVLGAGDSFHLVPRALALCTTGLENYAVPLGLGKWITSVTMTVFYVLLYYVWRKRYQIKGQKDLTIAVYALSAVRIVLCMMPQNQWLTNHTPLTWGILRNIPFALLGLLIIVLFPVRIRSFPGSNENASCFEKSDGCNTCSVFRFLVLSRNSASLLLYAANSISRSFSMICRLFSIPAIRRYDGELVS